MATIAINPDIHGQIDKLRAALANLGWQRRLEGWVHPEPRRRIQFLGDFIDRGPDNRAVIHIVRDLVDSGKAQAIMGNHELNALMFHTLHPQTGAPLRPHSEKNLRQHSSFLREFPVGDPATREVLAWMRATLPLFHEEPGFRAGHACWRQGAIEQLRGLTGDGRLHEEQLVVAADPNTKLHALVEEIAKGPEHPLPRGAFFTDKDGTRRSSVRLKWWNANARSWRDIAISVPNLQELPDEALPTRVRAAIYPSHERPVFFGHYWLTGAPVLQAPNVLCLDYSAGTVGPLVTYEFEDGDTGLRSSKIRVHS